MDPNDDLESLLLNDQPSTWNEQTGEALLQNLFVNTLHDDFHINDNLASLDTTNYSSVLPSVTSQGLSDSQSLDENLVSSLEKNLEIIQQQEIDKTKNEIEIGAMSDFVFNLDSSFNLTEQLNYNQNLNTIEPVDFILDDNNSEMLKAMKLNHDSSLFLPIEPATEMVVKEKAVVNVNEVGTTDDDIIFKKPTTAPSSTYLHSFFHSLPSNDSVLQLNEKLKLNKEKLSSQSDSGDLFSQFKKINESMSPHRQQDQQHGPSMKEEKTLNDLNLSASSYRQTQREQKIERGHSLTDFIEKNYEYQKDFSSSENNETLINIPSLSTSPVTNLNKTATTSINKLFTLKRSRKRTSKLVSNNTHSTTSSKTNGKQSSNCLDLAQKVTSSSSKQLKLNGQKKLTKKEKQQANSKHNQRHSESSFSSSFEPLSKKFAIDVETTHRSSEAFQGLKFINGHHLAKCNKEEVELHIKELSLLDLHSSEDDSSDRLANGGIASKNSLQFQTSQSVIPVIAVAAESNQGPKQTAGTFVAINQENSVSNSSINTANYDGNSSNPENDIESETSRLKKYKQYRKNNSIDSDSGVSIKSSCDSLNTKKKLKDSRSILTTASTVSSPSTHNKRKKQNNNEQYNNRNDTGQTFLIDLSSSLHSIAKSSRHTALESYDQNHSSSNLDLTKSEISLDIDTLQNMKNLDLNQDLPKETSSKNYSTVSIQNSSDKFKNADSTSLKPAERSQPKSEEANNLNGSINLNLNDKKSRQTLWNLLKAHSSKDEMIDQFGASLHDKISFWDLVQLKIKHSTKNELKTIYEITDDYTKLYSNMSTLLEGFVKEHSAQETSTRSRSSSRNYRKQT